MASAEQTDSTGSVPGQRTSPAGRRMSAVTGVVCVRAPDSGDYEGSQNYVLTIPKCLAYYALRPYAVGDTFIMATIGAQSQLARSIGAALIRYADDLDALEPEGEADLRTPDDVVLPEDEYNLGKRQRQIVNLPDLTTDSGIRTADIARAIDYEVPNTYTTLQALARAGIVEQVPNREPQHWRLARRYRPNSEAFMRMARHVRAGEWTTYGDISIAVFGNHKAARGVGRAAATIANFPNPHRVLLEGGVIAPTWEDRAGRGPEECRRRLAEEHITFTGDGRADPTRRIAWDELMRRDADA